jgi:hypothetical protein
MRVGIVRSDIAKVYLSDIENRSQRVFSSEPAGQSRYVVKPSDTDLTGVMNRYAILSALGTDAAATFDTTANNALKIRTTTGAYTTISVSSSLTLSKAQLAAELNAGFLNAGLPVVVTHFTSGANLNKLQFDTVAPNAGPNAKLQIDTAANGSTLNIALAAAWVLTPPNLSGISLATLKAAVYPTATTINVASATITALSTFSVMQATAQTNLVNAIADNIAPRLVETGPVLLSFVYGVMSKLRSAAFQPGGARVGLPAGVGAAIVADDGSTVFVV